MTQCMAPAVQGAVQPTAPSDVGEHGWGLPSRVGAAPNRPIPRTFSAQAPADHGPLTALPGPSAKNLRDGLLQVVLRIGLFQPRDITVVGRQTLGPVSRGKGERNVPLAENVGHRE